MIDRRDVLLSLGAAAMATPFARASAWSKERYGEKEYARATVIDALSAPGGFASEALAEIKSSGVTALSVTVGELGNDPGLFGNTIETIAGYERRISERPDAFLKVLEAADLAKAKASGRLGLVFHFQDASPIEGDLKRVQLFHSLGVRSMQLTYNRRNLVADGCLEPNDGGISLFGRELVAEINRLRLLLDLSHAGARTISEGIALSKAPLAISHTGCRDLVDVPRNTWDRDLEALADKGGVAGIYFMPFLRTSGQPRAEDLIRHIAHAVNVCGEEHVGLGTDGAIPAVRIDEKYAASHRKFVEERQALGIAAPGEAPDVFNLIPDYNHARRFLSLAEDLSRRGWPASRIDKVLGGNFARLFKDVWGA